MNLPNSLPSNVKLSVTAYLLTRAFAEITREQVDQVYTQVLSEPEFEIYNDARFARDLEPLQRITTRERLYLSKDEDTCQAIYAEMHKRLTSAGIKPASMSPEHCPALVAEDQLRKVQYSLVNAIGAMIGHPDILEPLLMHLDKYNQFIDLSVKMVCSHPDYTPPTLDAGSLPAIPEFEINPDKLAAKIARS